jgi:hypothetical protein
MQVTLVTPVTENWKLAQVFDVLAQPSFLPPLPPPSPRSSFLEDLPKQESVEKKTVEEMPHWLANHQVVSVVIELGLVPG